MELHYQATRAGMVDLELIIGRRLSIVPYIEANDLYSRLDLNKSWDADENRYLGFTSYLPYQCPGFPERPPVSTMASSHYLGIAGLGADAAELPQDSPRAGIFGYERQLTPADLGNSANTLVALESLQIQGSWTAGGPPTIRGLESPAAPYLGADGQFGGIHREGANALFADGSVRLLPQSLDPAVLETMTTIQASKKTDSVQHAVRNRYRLTVVETCFFREAWPRVSSVFSPSHSRDCAS